MIYLSAIASQHIFRLVFSEYIKFEYLYVKYPEIIYNI